MPRDLSTLRRAHLSPEAGPSISRSGPIPHFLDSADQSRGGPIPRRVYQKRGSPTSDLRRRRPSECGPRPQRRREGPRGRWRRARAPDLGLGFWRAPNLVLFFTNLVLFSRIWYRFHESGIVFPNLVLFSKRTCPTHDLRRRRPKAPRSPPRTMAAGAGLHFIPTSNRLFQPH